MTDTHNYKQASAAEPKFTLMLYQSSYLKKLTFAKIETGIIFQDN